MTVWFVTRHKGALDWARRCGVRDAQPVAHLDIAAVVVGDSVLGTLPVHLAAEVCARGARYLHLSMETPPDARGRELTADDMEAFGARLEEYRVVRVEGGDGAS